MTDCQFQRELIRLVATENGFELSGGGAASKSPGSNKAKHQTAFRTMIRKHRRKIKKFVETEENKIEGKKPPGPDHLEFLQSSPHNEVEKNGAFRVVIDLWIECGLMQWKADGKTLEPGPDLKFRQLFMYGDMLSMDHYGDFDKVLLNRVCDSGHQANAMVIFLAHAQVMAVWGELHLLMHMVAAIYRMVWGEFLDTIVLMLGMKRIGRDSTKYHKTCFDTLKAIYYESRRRSFLDFPSWIIEMYGMSGDIPVEGVAANVTVTYQLLQSSEDHDFVLPIIHSLYLEFRKSVDERFQGLGSFLFQLMDHVSMVLLFEEGVKKQKPALCEQIAIHLMPLLIMTNKYKYVNGIMRVTEQLYSKCSATQREKERLNRGIIFEQRSGAVRSNAQSDDDGCEKHNKTTSRQATSATEQETFIRKTADVTMNECARMTADALFGKLPSKKRRPVVSDKANLRAISGLLAELDPFNKEVPLVESVVRSVMPQYAVQPAAIEAPAPSTQDAAISQLLGAIPTELKLTEGEVEAMDQESSDDDEGSEDEATGSESRARFEQRVKNKSLKVKKRYPWHQYAASNWVEKGKEMLSGSVEKYNQRRQRKLKDKEQCEQALAYHKSKQDELNTETLYEALKEAESWEPPLWFTRANDLMRR